MTTSTEKTTAQVSRHLEFLGYTSTRQEDGWTLAAHPTRPDLCYRALPFGVRLVALFDLGRLSGDARAEWVEFANRCNGVGLFVRFALGAREGEGHSFRATAVFHGAYTRTAFGAFMDAWHSDMALMAHAPTAGDGAAADDEDDDEGGDTSAVTH